MMFNAGDRVRIIPGTRYYNRLHSSNPANVEGTIREINPSHEDWPIWVDWDNGDDNVYEREDLEYISPPKNIEEFL